MTDYYIAAKTSLSRSSELITLGAGLTGVMTACRPSWYIGGVHISVVPESTYMVMVSMMEISIFYTKIFFHEPTQKVNFISSK